MSSSHRRPFETLRWFSSSLVCRSELLQLSTSTSSKTTNSRAPSHMALWGSKHMVVFICAHTHACTDTHTYKHAHKHTHTIVTPPFSVPTKCEVVGLHIILFPALCQWHVWQRLMHVHYSPSSRSVGVFLDRFRLFFLYNERKNAITWVLVSKLTVWFLLCQPPLSEEQPVLMIQYPSILTEAWWSMKRHFVWNKLNKSHTWELVERFFKTSSYIDLASLCSADSWLIVFFLH
jgi:hypothetical protein